MKKILFTILILVVLSPLGYSQRIIFQSNFENIQLQSPDSIPLGWSKLDVDGNNPAIGWAVRDTSVRFGGGNTPPKAHNSAKSLEIPWYAGNGGNNINDDWVWTDTFTVHTQDSLIFWMLIGSDSTFTAYIDTMQVYVSSAQDPNAVIQKLATLKSNDSAGIALNNNVWTQHFFDLSAFNGQQVCVAFRYNMDISVNGLWCNIDDMFIGNRAAIGIHQISANIPKEFNLSQNYPNPFNPSTFINFALPRAEFVSIIIYNEIGQQVKNLVSQQMSPGYYKVDFDASYLSSGVYFYRINAGTFVQTKKMVLTK